MGEVIIVEPDVEPDFDRFLDSLRSALPNDFRFRFLLLHKRDELRQKFYSLSEAERLRYITFLRYRHEHFRQGLRFLDRNRNGGIVDSFRYLLGNPLWMEGRVDSIFSVLETLLWMEGRVDSSFSVRERLLWKQIEKENGNYPQSGKRIEFGAASSENYVQNRDDAFNPFRMANATLDLLGNNVGNWNNGASGTQFQHQLLEASDATPPGHDGATYPNNGATGNPFNCNTDVANSIDCFPTPSGPRASHACTLDKVTISLKEFVDFFKGNPEPARDDPTWFTTLLGINGSVIALISKTGSNPQSLPTKIMEPFTAICAVAGFCVSLAGLY